MKISIPKSCAKNRDEMLPEEKGRFCLNCQKSVLDCTRMRDEEILKSLNQKDICVRINPSQVKQINSESNLNFYLPKWFRYSSFLMAFGLSSISFGQINHELKYTTTQIEELMKKDTVITLRLQVVDDFEGDPIPGAKVFLTKKRKKYSTITDADGYFELEIPTKYLNDYLTVESEYFNRDYHIRHILNQEKIGNSIYLGKIELLDSKPYTNHLGEVIL